MKKQRYSYYTSEGFQFVFAENLEEAEKLISLTCGIHFIPERLRKSNLPLHN